MGTLRSQSYNSPRAWVAVFPRNKAASHPHPRPLWETEEVGGMFQATAQLIHSILPGRVSEGLTCSLKSGPSLYQEALFAPRGPLNHGTMSHMAEGPQHSNDTMLFIPVQPKTGSSPQSMHMALSASLSPQGCDTRLCVEIQIPFLSVAQGYMCEHCCS